MSREDRIPDAKARRDAVLTGRHAFVWASAGTGKTHTLTLRALYLLLNVPFQPAAASDAAATRMAREAEGLYFSEDRSHRLRAARAALRSVVMTTFTRKAASEMQARLFDYLDLLASAARREDLQSDSSRGRGPRADDLFLEVVDTVSAHLSARGLSGEQAYRRLRAGAEGLAELAAELQISTLHGFAAALLRRHPTAAGLSPSARFAREDQDDLSLLEDELVDRWWQKEGLADSSIQADAAAVLSVVPARHIREWLKGAYRYPWIVAEAEAIAAPEPAQALEALQAVEVLAEQLQSAGGDKVARVRGQLESFAKTIGGGRLEAWIKLYGVLKENRDYLSRDRTTNQTIRRAIDRMEPSLAQYFSSPHLLLQVAAQASLAWSHRHQWEAWKRIHRRFRDWAEGAAGRELNLVTFDDMIRGAVKLLENHPQIRRFENLRLRALLVDEFQDTDPLQLRLLAALLRGDPAQGHEVLGFFVGDVKQSIYRFRGVDVPSVEHFFRQFRSLAGSRIEPQEFYLKTSFRSLENVTGFVNAFFSQTLELAREEEKLVPFRPAPGPLPPADWLIVERDGEGESLQVDDMRADLARETVRLIQDYLKGEEDPPARYQDVLVLVSNRREMDALLPELQEAGIPVISAGARSFYRHPEVLDVLNLLIALHHPGDSLAVAAVLRSPLVHVSDEDLFNLLSPGLSSASLLHSEEPLPERLPEGAKRRLEELRRLVRERRERPLTEWLHRVKAFLPGPAYCDPGDREGRGLARIDRVLAAFRQEMDLGLTPPLTWLLRQRERAALADRFDTELGEDVILADESVEAVRVLTIHAAKGLEGRLVIVYGWESVLRSVTEGLRRRGDRTSTLESSQGGGRLRAFSLDWGPLTVISRRYPEAAVLEEESLQREAKNLAYVASTRARDRLVLLSHGAARRNQLPDAVREQLEEVHTARANDGAESVLLHDGWLRLSFRKAPGTRSEEPTRTSAGIEPQEYRMLWSARQAALAKPGPPPLGRPSDPGQEEDDLEPAVPLRIAAGGAGLVAGRWIHRYLEKHLLDPGFDPRRLEAIAAADPAGREGGRVLPLAAARLKAFYGGTYRDDRDTPYVERVSRARVLARELPVFLEIGGQAWNGVIDLVLEEDGGICGVDYKSTSPQEVLPAAYRQQSEIYTEALRRLFPEKAVTFEFWWLEEA